MSKIKNESMRIAGKKINAEKVIDVIYPYTGNVIGTVPAGNAEHAKQALDIAAKFTPKLTRYERQKILQNAAEALINRKEEISDVNNLNMSLDVNGKRMQTGNTSTMIFNVDVIVSYLSKYMSLQAGDIITTGTPPGVGMGMKPQQFLKAGDTMKLSIENLGEQNSKVVAL